MTTGLFNGQAKVRTGEKFRRCFITGNNCKNVFPKEISIKEGSYIVVKSENKTTELKNTGATAEFQTHCEVVAEYVKEWA